MFDFQKKVALERKDNSKKGSVDMEIESLVNLVNSKKGYYTTSSCAGRIVLLKVAEPKRKINSEWILASHKKVTLSQLKAALKDIPKDELWFKQEPFIAHIVCRTLDNAKELLRICNECGFKHSGINALSNKITVEVGGSDFVEAIIAKDSRLLCDDSYLKALLQAANKKLEANLKKIERFEKLVKSL